MKVDLKQFPTIKNLADDVRDKALEYAATLGARGPRPTTVLGTAVTLAKEWKSGRLAARPGSAPFLVQPRQGRWVIKRSTEAEASHTFLKKDDAVRRAQELARAAGAACFVFGPGGTLIERYEAKMLAQLELVPAPAETSEVVMPSLDDLPAASLAPVVEAEVAPVIEAEVAPVVEAEVAPVVEAEVAPVVEAEVAPVVEEAPEELDALDEPAPGEEPLRVKKIANKWMVFLGDGRSETFSNQKKALARAKALGKKLGRAVVVA